MYDSTLLFQALEKDQAVAYGAVYKAQQKRIEELQAQHKAMCASAGEAWSREAVWMDRVVKYDAVLSEAVEWFERHRPEWGPGTLPTWFVDGKQLCELRRAEAGSSQPTDK